jgi:succinoglycan biosynthesis transport protein ExoP
VSKPDGSSERTVDWLRPRVEQHGLQRYVSTLRERKLLILLTVVLTTAVAGLYVATADKKYDAEADILVTPAPRDDPALAGLGLLRESSDPTRDVETAARLITNRDVAERVRRNLRSPEPAKDLLEKVKAEPVAQSNIVAVTARARTPERARNFANAFAQAAVEDRTEEFRRQLDAKITSLRQSIEALPPGARGAAGPDSPEGQLARLEALRGGQDPTMRLETRAVAPENPATPRPKLTILAGLFVGLVLGIGAAFALQVLDPRLRREEQLRALYGLPILGRIPREARRSDRALTPERLSPGTLEAYRTLRATLAASRPEGVSAPAILVTSPSPSEGKTTTAINLASSLALAGNSVALIEADLRRPAVASALEVDPKHGTGAVLLGASDLEDALVETKAYGRYLRVLVADHAGGASGFMADQLFLPAARKLVDDAKAIADFVVIDSPPLSEVIDALPLAQQADEVLLVVRLGRTQLPKLQNLGELLAQHDIAPVGFAVVGVPPSGAGYYYATSGGDSRARQRAGDGARQPASRQPA